MVQTCAIGVLLFDMPHSALNNFGLSLESSYENAIAVKTIQKGKDTHPYISAQAWRYWWRNTLRDKEGWQLSPIERGKKIAFTQVDPLQYPDDDVFGYMKTKDAMAVRNKKNVPENESGDNENTTLTRISPLKCSPLISVTPTRLTDDKGVMARHEGHPVTYGSQFYSTIMKGSFSLDLSSIGCFLAQKRAGYQNINESKKEEYLKMGAVEEEGIVKVSQDIRAKRASDTVKVLAFLSGGAKQTLFLTDVVPKMGIFVVFEGGNHPLMSVVYNKENKPFVDIEALKTVISEYKDCLKSKIYIGKSAGFMTEMDDLLQVLGAEKEFECGSFKEIVDKFAKSVSAFYGLG